MTLKDMSDKQLSRLWRKCWSKLRENSGYQPWGFDWPTLRINDPSLYRTMQAIANEADIRKGRP